jgi:catechol 2,3-dioxygenase-like lactoylglutathione lyase family enzyme
MLGSKNAVATIAVKSVKAAESFYKDTLGLAPAPAEENGVLVFGSGSSKVFVYESQFAGTNKATAATWEVDKIDEVVKALRSKGVTFEHYDSPGMEREGDIHRAGKMKAAWLKDPDGNILALVGS